jgi:chorismate--pyruvate lyase
MWAKEDPCWYARTIIPNTSYQENDVFFNRLQKESLGALIFNESRIKRVHMMHYPVNTQSIEYHWVTKCVPCSVKTLWTRFSIFILNDEFPFYLIEILLPALERYS